MNTYQQLQKLALKNQQRSDLTVSDTGAIRYNGNKLRLDLVPYGPLLEVAKVYTYGAKKYSERNWEKGFKWSSVFASIMRHLVAWYIGEDQDPETGINHMAHVVANCFMILEFTLRGTGEDDRPTYAQFP